MNFSPLFLSKHKTIHFSGLLLILLLAFVSSSIMQMDDVIQQLFTDANQADFEIKFSLSLLVFHLLLWLSGNRLLAIIIMLVFCLLQIGQLGHISYVGRPLDPLTLSSVFDEAGDIHLAMAASIKEHIHILLAIGLPYSLLILMFWKLMPSQHQGLVRWLCYFFIFVILASKPYRAMHRDLNMFLPSPTRPSLYNSLDTYSYFLIHGLPKLSDAMPIAPIPEPKLTPISSSSNNVWLIIVDSLRSDHLSLYGYDRPTTPKLASWLNQGLSVQHGVSGSVATASSIPLMMNTIYDPGNISQIKSETTNLFKLAHEHGFKTFWLSSQNSRILNDLGARYIDVLIGEEEDPLLFEYEKDGGIVNLLAQQPWGDKNFTVILLRGTHAPYENNYAHVRENFAKWDDSDTLSRQQRSINAYDNSMLYVDTVLDQILQVIATQKGERHVVITSDHGQLLGEKNLWGHNLMEPQVASVPMLSLSWDAPEANTLVSSTQHAMWVSHFDMSRWLAQRLGTMIELPQYQPNVTYLQGKNLYGMNQYREIHTNGNAQLEFLPPKNTRDYRPHSSQ